MANNPRPMMTQRPIAYVTGGTYQVAYTFGDMGEHVPYELLEEIIDAGAPIDAPCWIPGGPVACLGHEWAQGRKVFDALTGREW